MKNLCLTILFVGFASTTYANPASTNLAGSYKVKGECAYRAKNGEYRSCTSWNRLTLKRTRNANEFEFTLVTNTFATTQGGCSLDGTLRLRTSNGVSRLVRSDSQEDSCNLSFEVTRHKLVLDVPEAEEFTTCKRFCGFNSTLSSDSFPRASRQP